MLIFHIICHYRTGIIVPLCLFSSYQAGGKVPAQGNCSSNRVLFVRSKPEGFRWRQGSHEILPALPWPSHSPNTDPHVQVSCQVFWPQLQARDDEEVFFIMPVLRDFCRVDEKGFSSYSSLWKPFHLCWKHKSFNRRQLFLSSAPFAMDTPNVSLLGPLLNIYKNHTSKKTWFHSSNQLPQGFQQNSRMILFCIIAL